MDLVGRKGTPIAAARYLNPRLIWLHSSYVASPDCTKCLMIRETPQVTPGLNQLVMMCLVVPATRRRSPSVAVMLLEKTSPFFLCLISSQISAMGVRE